MTPPQMTKTPFSSPGILILEFKSNAMFDEFINQILGDERVVVPSHQENKAEPDVIEEKTAEIRIPKKYQEDIESLKGIYQGDFKTGFCINLTLQDALKILPRERKRVDAYRGLVSFLKEKMGIELNIKSQKSKQED